MTVVERTAADDLSEPEPDLYVTSPDAVARRGLPTAASLVVEVAGSSRTYDLGVKAGLYARVGVPDYWVVDLGNDCVVVHGQPSASGYRHVEPVAAGAVSALHHAGVQVDVAVLLRSGG